MIKKEELGNFVNDLPYELTAAQKRVYEEIEKELLKLISVGDECEK